MIQYTEAETCCVHVSEAVNKAVRLHEVTSDAVSDAVKIRHEVA